MFRKGSTLFSIHQSWFLSSYCFMLWWWLEMKDRLLKHVSNEERKASICSNLSCFGDTWNISSIVTHKNLSRFNFPFISKFIFDWACRKMFNDTHLKVMQNSHETAIAKLGFNDKFCRQCSFYFNFHWAHKVEYIFEYIFRMVGHHLMKLGQLIETVVDSILGKLFAWIWALGPNSTSFSVYQPTAINEKPRQSNIVNVSNKAPINCIILSFYQIHKRVWNQFPVFPIQLKESLNCFLLVAPTSKN